ncbi:hypothetical protein [Acidomonas methanolica]|uniref:hypothetical protein n=1 Tax=Acidomonas methanolica TaxID=437 RepID=UPI001050082C|nr:hypothetical protein [Acidomonas methanolica]MBU2654107.1 hypothetical protein [Acidomonas methanolica]
MRRPPFEPVPGAARPRSRGDASLLRGREARFKVRGATVRKQRSFLKKEPKNFFDLRYSPPVTLRRQRIKIFLLLFLENKKAIPTGNRNSPYF